MAGSVGRGPGRLSAGRAAPADCPPTDARSAREQRASTASATSASSHGAAPLATTSGRPATQRPHGDRGRPGAGRPGHGQQHAAARGVSQRQDSASGTCQGPAPRRGLPSVDERATREQGLEQRATPRGGRRRAREHGEDGRRGPAAAGRRAADMPRQLRPRPSHGTDELRPPSGCRRGSPAPRGVQAGVDAAGGDQVAVRAALHEAARVDDDHLVGGSAVESRWAIVTWCGPRSAARAPASSRTSVAGSTALVASSSTSRSGSAR